MHSINTSVSPYWGAIQEPRDEEFQEENSWGCSFPGSIKTPEERADSEKVFPREAPKLSENSRRAGMQGPTKPTASHQGLPERAEEWKERFTESLRR